MAALAQEIDVDVAERRPEPVSIFRLIKLAAVVFDFEPVGKIVAGAEVDLEKTAFVKAVHHTARNAVAADHLN